MASNASVLLYHESQVAALCGVHCLNTLLQGPYFSEIDLAQIAAELDALERSVMAEGGLEASDYLNFMAMESGNVANDGMFSIQVLGKALHNWGVSYDSLDSPDMQAAAQHPDQEQAFICNLREHWFTSAGADTPDGPGRWFTPAEAKQRSTDPEEAKQGAYLKAALDRLLPEPGTDASGNPLEPRPIKLVLRPREPGAEAPVHLLCKRPLLLDLLSGSADLSVCCRQLLL
ncbi:hypothetical protein WJX73_000078 [Symbiochloris irregularis]|uniref:ubiquitinyl hydrolase 1 n=1 Tax=Symbiochloris irregularis TaxID=706552 RepID=A0AAW1NLQ3_9CHLO